MKNGLRMKSEKREEEKQERGVEWSEMVQGAKTRQQGWAGREECSHGGPCGAQRGSDEDSGMEDERGTERE